MISDFIYHLTSTFQEYTSLNEGNNFTSALFTFFVDDLKTEIIGSFNSKQLWATACAQSEALLVVDDQPQPALQPFLDNSQGLQAQGGQELALGLLQGAPGTVLLPNLNLH